jgi:hypothetical protein
MAKTYGANTAPRGQLPVGQVDGSVQGGHVRVYREKITLASQAAADTIVVGYPSKGESFLYGVLTSDTDLGATATVAIGNSTATGKYRAPATFRTILTPTLFGAVSTDVGGLSKLTIDEEVVVTVGAAALPAAGNLYVDLYFAAT